MGGQLVVIAGPDQGRVFPLPKEGQALVIGRGQQTATKLKDPEVSRVHCEVCLAGGRALLKDAASSTGTLYKNKRIVEHELRPGDVFQIGGTTLRYELEVSPEAATVLVNRSSAELPALAGEVHYRHLHGHSEQEVLVLTILEGQVLDEDLTEALRLELLMAVAHASAHKVALDFQNVKSVSSAAFRPLLSLQSKLGERKGRLVLCGLSPLVAQVFRMSGLIDPGSPADGPFAVADDVPAAVAQLSAGASA